MRQALRWTLILGLVSSLAPAIADEKKEGPTYAVDPALYQAMKWRNVGPHRGGEVLPGVAHRRQLLPVALPVSP